MKIQTTVREVIKCICSVVTIIILFTYLPCHAQLKPGNLTQFTEKDGVPGSQIRSVLVDKFGYIWLGTINGLGRYDGYEFKRFFSNPNDSTSIKGLVVWSLFEDRKGQIWIGTSAGNLNVYDPVSRSFRQYYFDELINHPFDVEINVNTICQDNKGRIYFGIQTNYGEPINTGLLYLDENDNTIKKNPVPDSLQIGNVLKITKDKAGNIWVLSYNGLFKIDVNRNLKKIRSQSLEERLKKNVDFPADIKADNAGHLWFITQKSDLYDFNVQSGSYKTYSGDKQDKRRINGFSIRSIEFDKNENIWIGTNTGLHFFNRKTGEFEGFVNESNNGTEKAAILDLKFDSFGTLWVGTLSEGLLKYEERNVLKSYSFDKNKKVSLAPGWANNLYESSEGKIWISTSDMGNFGLNELDPQSGTIHAFPIQSFIPGAHTIFGLRENSPGEFYISTDMGCYIFLLKTNSLKKIKFNGVPDSLLISQFLSDSKGNLWLCTRNGLFKRNRGIDKFTKYDLSLVKGSNESSNQITKAFESKKHGLWLLTNNGLFLYDYKTDKIVRYGFDKKSGDIFITQDINSFYEDTAGIAWVGTWQGGLSRYNVETGKIKTYTRNDGLPSMSVQGILPDEENYSLWLSTFEGLSRFNLKTGQFNNYSIADGIQSQQFADGSYLKTTQGQYVFGGSNGITIFSDKDVTNNSISPLVFLTDLKLFNKSVMPGENSVLKNPIYDTKEITLPYDQKNITIEFEALHYSNPAKNKCAYKLENYDNEWREVGNQHLASFPMLPPGKYIFHVKAANNIGVWNEQGASLTIIINPPWWRTIWAYCLYVLLFAAGIFGADRYFRHRVIQKERERNRTRELEQAREIEKAYTELKATQTQLIQSEKMASLGELTAGIAHEIQNPLNFVNNFSEINKELLLEMKDELDKGNMAEVNSIANDVIDNEEKINYHGKRADAIVKGMLQHSRSSSGVKEPTDINALADEYLRLSYHGSRAKDKSFNTTLKTDFDESIGKINIVPQDIGRVILNLLTNAFYAVTEKKKLSIEGYEPVVSVITKKDDKKVEIIVKDNGIGIPQKALDKIFQPFFTTKPTGEGTGLGLSLSYDIVKAHGGDIKIDTNEGEGTEFIIELPAVRITVYKA